jgi:hypothetical protein
MERIIIITVILNFNCKQVNYRTNTSHNKHYQINFATNCSSFNFNFSNSINAYIVVTIKASSAFIALIAATTSFASDTLIAFTAFNRILINFENSIGLNYFTVIIVIIGDIVNIELISIVIDLSVISDISLIANSIVILATEIFIITPQDSFQDETNYNVYLQEYKIHHHNLFVNPLKKISNSLANNLMAYFTKINQDENSHCFGFGSCSTSVFAFYKLVAEF